MWQEKRCGAQCVARQKSYPARPQAQSARPPYAARGEQDPPQALYQVSAYCQRLQKSSSSSNCLIFFDFYNLTHTRHKRGIFAVG